MGRHGVNNKIEKHKTAAAEINGLVMGRLQSSIQWAGQVRLHQTGEELESLLAECEWPNKSGKFYFACASTGLLFDKQSGACKQASTVQLLIDTVQPRKCSAAGFKVWIGARLNCGFNNAAKRGPKPGGAAARALRAVQDEESDEWGDDDA